MITIKKSHAKTFFLTLALTVLLSVSASAQSASDYQFSEGKRITGEMYDKFMAYKVRTMTYDETRITYYEGNSGKDAGMLKYDDAGGGTMKIRYFYQSPARHAYRMLSKPLKNYWQGSPNQPGATPMNEFWKDKILNWYYIARANDVVYRGQPCYVLSLVPKPNADPDTNIMTWYIDQKNLVILKLRLTVKNGNQTVVAESELFYKDFDGHLLPETANWKTKVSSFPYFFIQKVTYENYVFNIPLDDSVFKEELPKSWRTPPEGSKN